MSPELKAALVQAASVRMMAELLGMAAENQFRQVCGHVPSYGEDAFANVAVRHGLEPDQIQKFLGE